MLVTQHVFFADFSHLITHPDANRDKEYLASVKRSELLRCLGIGGVDALLDATFGVISGLQRMVS